MGHSEGHKGNKNVLHGLEEDLVCELPVVLPFLVLFAKCNNVDLCVVMDRYLYLYLYLKC